MTVQGWIQEGEFVRRSEDGMEVPQWGQEGLGEVCRN